MASHLKILAVLYIIGSLGELLGALILFGIGIFAGALGPDPLGAVLTAGVSTAIGLFLLVLALPGLILAYSLLRHRSWARPLGFLLGFLNLFNIPLGTLLGFYTFWVLTRTESKMILAGNKVL